MNLVSGQENRAHVVSLPQQTFRSPHEGHSPQPGKKRSRSRSSKRHQPHSTHTHTRDSVSPPDFQCQWQTLQDVLQDIDLNGLVLKGVPMRKGTRIPVMAQQPPEPPTPVYLPIQTVDTRPLAYLQLLQDEQIPLPDQAFFRPSEHQRQSFPVTWLERPHHQQEQPQVQMPGRCPEHPVQRSEQHKQLPKQPAEAGKQTEGESQSPKNAFELALDKIFSSPTMRQSASIHRGAASLKRSRGQPEGTAHISPHDNWHHQAHFPAGQPATNSAPEAIWQQPPLPTQALVPHALSHPHMGFQQPLQCSAPASSHRQPLEWSAPPSSHQDSQQQSTCDAAHHTPHLQPHRTSPQPESPCHAFQLAWPLPSIPAAPPLFASPAQSPIMQDGQAIFQTTQQPLASSLCCPANTMSQAEPRGIPLHDTEQVSEAPATMPCHSPFVLWNSPATPATASLPCHDQRMAASAMHPFQRKPSLPRSFTMIPVARPTLYTPAGLNAVSAVEQSMCQSDLPPAYRQAQPVLQNLTTTMKDQIADRAPDAGASHCIVHALPLPIGSSSGFVEPPAVATIALPTSGQSRCVISPGQLPLLYSLESIACSAHHILRSLGESTSAQSSRQDRVSHL